MLFQVKVGSYDPDKLTVLAFRGREAASRDYRFVLTVASDVDPSAFEAAVLDQPATLTIHGDGRPSRIVHGVVARIGYHEEHALGHSFQLTIVPRLHRLRHRQTSRIFQDLSVPEIIDVILGLHDVPCRRALVRPCPKRLYAVQYRETDHAFISRLCREEGFFYYYEHSPQAAAELLVLSDDVGLCPPIAGQIDLAYRPAAAAGGLTVQEHHVPRFAAQRTVVPTAVTVQEYDFERPCAKLVSDAATAQLEGGGEDRRYERYEHHSDYEKVEVEGGEAQIRLEQLRRNAHLATGETPCRRLVPGHRFKLGHHPLQAYNRGWLVISAEHEGKESPAGGEPSYECRFRAARDDVQFRSPIARRRLQQVVETATVTGPEGEEIHTDVYGRIKIRFHWDREGPGDDHSSCWIRHAEHWAGPGYGTQLIPRVGMEVLVTFLGGDLDRPLVIGCVSNATHLPPFPLPAEQAKSGLKTRSTPRSQGYNELSFDDTSGREQVRLRAEKDLTVAVGHDQSVHVENNSSFSTGAFELHQAGSRRTSIAGADELSVSGNRRVDVIKDSDIEIGGNRRTRVKCLDRLTVEGPSELVVNQTRMVRAGESYSLLVGERAISGTCQVSSEGTLSLSAVQALRVSSEERLVIACGDATSIELDSRGIVLRAPKIALIGSEGVTVVGQGPALSLTDNAELCADNVTVLSKGGGLELGGDASLWGKIIKLNCSKADPSKVSDENDEKTKPFKVQLLDEGAEPYESKRYLLVAQGERQQGDTDMEGRIETEIPEDAALVDLTLWIDDYPTGRKRQWSIGVSPLADPTTTLGALQRLKNLGYYSGGIADDPQPDEEFRAALQWFQKDQELPQTGQLDGATAAELSAVHSS